MINTFRRSAYLFLSGLMGLLMFFILHRIVIFFFLFIATLGDADFAYYRFLIWDYSTLTIALVFGALYGMWLGKYWYKVVYHEKVHNGLVDFINTKLWGESRTEPAVFKHKLETVTEKFETNLLELEKLSESAPKVPLKPKAVVKRVAKTTAKKTVGSKTKKAAAPKKKKAA